MTRDEYIDHMNRLEDELALYLRRCIEAFTAETGIPISGVRVNFADVRTFSERRCVPVISSVEVDAG